MDLSEPKLISPMLDNFAMGAPISDHHGVRCCPAMEKDSDNRYIVKILSIPASRVQLDALLLTGAYSSESDAQEYFKALADGVQEEVNILNKLSKLEGFIPYDGCQIVPMENETGYDVYLLSPYKRSLEKFFRKNTMTHLAAVNLGLDMCAALAICRQAGYLYVDLKPENIFVSPDNEFRIGDLGFVKLDSLKYASLPDKYRSAYTSPEITDALSSLNTTMDVYAAGLILYQAYNGGVLPFDGQASSESLAAPIFADYEMAEIILKACDPDPDQRWNDPIQMGQALVSYMQRNGANDTPIVPEPVKEPDAPTEELAAEMPASEQEEVIDEFLRDESVDENTDIQICLEEFSEDSSEETAEPEELPAEPEVTVTEEAENTEVSTEETDETLPSEETTEDISYDELSDELSDILTQADELISHEAPEPVVAPEPIEIVIPEPVALENESEKTEAPAEDESDLSEIPTEPDEATAEEEIIEETYDEETEEEYDDELDVQEHFSAKKVLAIILALVLLAGLAFGGYYLYKNYYLQPVTALTLDGNEDQLRVSVTTDVDESLLKVVCVDTYGTRLEQPVENGIAVFTGLNPNMLYSVKVEVSGLRKLTGETSDSYSTPMQTGIVSLNAVTGSEGGTAIISFAVEGNDADSWTINYCAEGEELVTHTFSGHMATITGLTVGKTYTFDLSSDSEAYLTGTTQIEYTAAVPVCAENLAVTGLGDGSISVSWSAPEGALVTNWIVRCYDEGSYNETVTVTDTTASFSGLVDQSAYTIEVTAEGMSTGVRSYITANAVTVTNAAADLRNANSISVTWDCADPSAGNWVVVYSIDGIDEQNTVKTAENSAIISPVVPNASYTISICQENGSTVLGGDVTVAVPAAPAFNGHALGYIVKDNPIQFSMCVKPDIADWSQSDVNAYTDSFTVGQKAGFVGYIPSQYNTPEDLISVLFVIRDESGVLVRYDITPAAPWYSMWYRRYCELDVPSLPEIAGNYTIEVYFNGLLAHQQNFTVS